jgi:hypothetical protein
LIEYIRALENKNNSARGSLIRASLDALEIESSIQECRLPHIKNIIVDFSSGSKEKCLLFSAHYDSVKNSPGANDNASGVAVLLRLCQELKHIRPPVKIVFFDREEAWLRTPIINLGLLGSLFYVNTNKLGNLAAVYNLEFCGLGDFLGIWPVKGKDFGLDAFSRATAAAETLNIPFKSAHIPWPLLSSDHLSFRLKGISNSLTLSLLPANQVPGLENLFSRINLIDIFLRRRKILPAPLSSMHSSRDNSSLLSEDSLRLMLSLLKEIIHEHCHRSNC